MRKAFSILFLFIAQSLFAQATVLTPTDVAGIEYITDAVISDDGKTVVYQKLIPVDPEAENAPANVYLYIYDLSTERVLDSVTGFNTNNINFRPGSNSITFTAKMPNDKSAALYELTMAGSEPQKIYEFESSISAYHWHPNGQQLVFVSHEAKENDTASLPYKAEVYEEEVRNSSAYILDLSSPSPRPLNLEGHVTAAEWSPAGDRLAVSATPSSLVDDFYTGQKIYFVDPQNLNVTAQVDHKAKLGAFEWSPNGERIAFIAGADQHDPIDGRIFIAEPAGGNPQALQQEFEGKFEGLAWKNNNTLTFLASEGVYSSLGTIGLNGEMERLYQDNKVNVTAFSMAKDNTTVLIANTAQHPNEIYMLNPNASSAERMTTSNPWLQNERFGKQEVISYKTSDGMEIQGILIHPVNSTGKAPMITVVHGGPEAHYDNGWLTGYNMPGQMGAGAGYYVFYPNYRGSTGRGVEFAQTSQGDPAGKEFDDIIEGIDHLIANFDVDRDKVGVTGGSYGGYATAWMSTRHTERFAAGVMSVGISNNISKWGTSDIPEEMFLVHSRKRIWDDYQFFLERSPIFYADQSKTPLLILHGKEDTRVDPGQSYELYRHIKTRTDNPVRLVLYPGEGHGNRKSTARYDYSLRMMRWFNTFLKEDANEIPEKEIAVSTE